MTANKRLMLSEKNPFEHVVDFIGIDYVPVTLDLLGKVNEFYIVGGIDLQTYGEIFDSLKFLHEHRVIELIHDPDNNRHLVKSIYGKLNQQV